MSTENLDVVVSERGARVVQRNIELIGTAAVTTEGALSELQGALRGLAAAFLLNELKELLDTYTLLSNRLRLVSISSANLATIQENVFESAQRTRSTYESTAALFSRLAVATARFGQSQADALALTQTVSETMRISGATTSEATAAMYQFSQAMAKGRLDGDELRSILENSPRLAIAIADGLGVAVGQLRQMGKEGKLTTSVIIDALQKEAPKIAAEFSRIKPTITEAGTVMYNAILRTVGAFDQATGASAAFAGFIIELSKHMDVLVLVLGAFSIALLVAFGPPAITALYAFATALAFSTGGLSLIIPLLFAIGAAVLMWGDQWRVAGQGASTVIDYVWAAISMLGDALGPMGQELLRFFTFIGGGISAVWDGVSAFFRGNWQDMLGVVGVVVRLILATVAGLGGAVKAVFLNIPAIIEGAFKLIVNSMIDQFQNLINMMTTGINGLRSLANMEAIKAPDLTPFKMEMSQGAKDVGAAVADGFAQGFSQGDSEAKAGLGALADGVEELNARAAAQAQKRADAARIIAEDARLRGQRGDAEFTATPPVLGNPDGTGGGAKKGASFASELAKVNTEIQRQNELYAQGSRQMEVSNKLYEIEDRLRKSGKSLSEDERILLTEKLTLLQELEDKTTARNNILSGLDQAERDYNSTQQAANDLMKEGIITAEEYSRAIREVAEAAMIAKGGPLAGLGAALVSLQRDSVNMAEDVRDAVKSAFQGMEDALTTFVTTGKLDFSGLVDSIIEDIARLIIRYMIMQPIIAALSSIIPGLGGMATGGGFNVGAGGASGMGYATGGGFTVGGSSSGVDSQLVQFMATPGERVDVTHPGSQTQSGNGAGSISPKVTINVHNYAENAKGSAQATPGPGGTLTIDVLVEQITNKVAGDVAKGGTTINRAMEGRYGLNSAQGNQR